MKHRLASPGSAVVDDPVAFSNQPDTASRLGGGQKQPPEQRDVVRACGVQRRDVSPRNDQQVCRRLRGEVMEHQHLLVGKQDAGWNLPRREAAEQALTHDHQG